MPDLNSSWLSFKVSSRFRRLINTECAWEKIFEENLKTILPNSSKSDLYINIGSYTLDTISKIIPSVFWGECIKALGIVY